LTPKTRHSLKSAGRKQDSGENNNNKSLNFG
jgi:hypothetical protein